MNIYYEDERFIVTEHDGKYDLFDRKFNRETHKNESKEWIDDFISRVLSKRRNPAMAKTKPDFVLNDIFKQNAKVYQSRPVKAAKYQPGMESAWMIYFSNWNIRKKDIPVYEGVKFFPTEADARAYVEANKKQYMMLDGKLVESEVEYDLIKPVLLRKVVDAGNRVGINFEFGDNTFLADESKDYELYILEADTWIIQDADGGIRVWDRGFLDLFGATFFGNTEEIVYEKVSEDKYIKVAV